MVSGATVVSEGAVVVSGGVDVEEDDPATGAGEVVDVLTDCSMGSGACVVEDTVEDAGEHAAPNSAPTTMTPQTRRRNAPSQSLRA